MGNTELSLLLFLWTLVYLNTLAHVEDAYPKASFVMRHLTCVALPSAVVGIVLLFRYAIKM